MKNRYARWRSSLCRGVSAGQTAPKYADTQLLHSKTHSNTALNQMKLDVWSVHKNQYLRFYMHKSSKRALWTDCNTYTQQDVLQWKDKLPVKIHTDICCISSQRCWLGFLVRTCSGQSSSCTQTQKTMCSALCRLPCCSRERSFSKRCDDASPCSPQCSVCVLNISLVLQMYFQWHKIMFNFISHVSKTFVKIKWKRTGSTLLQHTSFFSPALS